MKTTKKVVTEWLMIVLGTAITAAGVHFFMLPSNLTVGSASALAMIISSFVPLPVSAVTFIINAVLLVVGFLLIGRDFGAKTVCTSILLPAFLRVYELLFPDLASITGDAFVDMVCYIFTVGLGLGILFNCNASSGGLDIVAKLMNKYLRIELGKAMALSGMAVAVSGVFLYDVKTMVISVLGTYMGGIVMDHFIFGMNVKRRVCIISPKLDEIVDFTLHQLHSGATIYENIGAYNNQRGREVQIIVDKSEYSRLMDFVMKADPHAFVTVMTVNEVNYRPKVLSK